MHWRGSVPLGTFSLRRERGLSVRLHWTLLLFAALEVVRAATREGASVSHALLTILAFAIALTVHEWGHCLAARRIGESTIGTTIGPFGGLEPVADPADPVGMRALALGGPIASGAVALLLLPYVIATDQAHSTFLRIVPAGGSPDLVATMWGAHSDLFLINLIPAFPFDGGRVVHALLHASSGAMTAIEKTVLCGRFCAAGAVLYWLLHLDTGGIILLAGGLCWVGSEIERRAAAMGVGRETWQEPKPPEPTRLGRWWGDRVERERSRRHEIEARERVAEASELDALLDRVHREGLESLSRRERKFLERVSKKMKEQRGDDRSSEGPRE